VSYGELELADKAIVAHGESEDRVDWT